MINILITGVSSGIGEAIAESCIDKGYHVFGTLRTEAQVKVCQKRWGQKFTPLLMDVKQPGTISEGVALVKRELNGDRLHVLINNSGIVKAGPLELQSQSDIREMFEVNVFGLIEVTRAFLPLMKFARKNKSAAKVINISSTAGQIGIPFLAGYVATKHAVEGLSHSWRRELMPFGIDVILIAPGNVITPIWDKAKEETVFFDESPYKDAFRNFFDFSFAESAKGMKPEEIAEVVMKAIDTDKPRVRYAPVAQKLMNWYIPRLISPRNLDSILFRNMKMSKQYSD